MSISIIGIVIRDDEVAAHLTTSDASETLMTSLAECGAGWTEVLASVLDKLNVTRLSRLRLMMMVGGSHVRHKRLFDVAPGMSSNAVAAQLTESPSSFFLGRPEQFVTSDPVIVEDEWWAVAIDRALVHAAVAMCASRGIEFGGLLPIGPSASATPLLELAQSATALHGSEPFFVDPNRRTRERRRVIRRHGLLSALLIVGLTAAAIGPSSIRLARASMMERELQAAHGSLSASDVASRVELLNAFVLQRRQQELLASSPSHATLLPLIASALPDSTAIISLISDSLLVRLVVLTRPASDLLETLEAAPQIRRARLAGPTVSQRIGNTDVQRASITFEIVARSEWP